MFLYIGLMRPRSGDCITGVRDDREAVLDVSEEHGLVHILGVLECNADTALTEVSNRVRSDP